MGSICFWRHVSLRPRLRTLADFGDLNEITARRINPAAALHHSPSDISGLYLRTTRYGLAEVCGMWCKAPRMPLRVD
jgi:hypothetical protein